MFNYITVLRYFIENIHKISIKRKVQAIVWTYSYRTIKLYLDLIVIKGNLLYKIANKHFGF